MMKKKNTKSVIGAMLFAGMIASGSYALTAGNTVEASKAGDGSGAVSGYAATNIKYALDSTDPSKAASVSFDLDSAPGQVKAQVVTSGSWFNCSNTGTAVTCNLGASGVSVASINTLRVVAAD